MTLDWNLITLDVLQSIDFDQLLSEVEQRECLAYGEALPRDSEDDEKWSPSQKQCISFVSNATRLGLIGAAKIHGLDHGLYRKCCFQLSPTCEVGHPDAS